MMSRAVLLSLALGSLFYLLFGNRLIASMYEGESAPFLNRLIDNRANEPVAWYFRRGRLFFSRFLFVGAIAYLTAVCAAKRERVGKIIRDFFTAEAGPVNLAIFRIVFFGTLLAWDELPKVVWYSRLPEELQFPLGGLGWVFHHLPFDEASVLTAITALKVVCVTGILGLFSRLSAFLAAVLGFYVLGIPQCFGKVVHYSHLVWFPLLLAATPCGDTLSCDALFRSWKRADCGVTDPPSASRAYGLPMQFILLLMGVLFFFPGFWKWWVSGIDWAVGDNLKYHIYSKWYELGGWRPFFRIDHYPFLYQSAALVTLFFEISLVFLIFFPKVRPWLAVAGLLFHNFTNAFMQIGFWALQPLYVAFINWQGVFHRIGRRLYRKEMFVIYDGTCKLCRRTIASIRVFDLFGHVTYLNALDRHSLERYGLTWLNQEELLTHMHAVVGEKRTLGFEAYRAWALRLPLLWPIVPFFYLWPIPAIGQKVYQRVANSRTCRVHEVPLSRPEGTGGRHRPLRATTAVGILLALLTFFYGLREETHAWPFTCYPTFCVLQKPTHRVLLVSSVTPKGERPLSLEALSERFRSSRWWGMILRILKEEDPLRQRERLKALWRLQERLDPDLERIRVLRFYEAVVTTSPEQRGEPLERPKLLFEWRRDDIPER